MNYYKNFLLRDHRIDTQKTYESVLEQFKKYHPNMLPDELTAESVGKWRNMVLPHLSRATWNKYVSHISPLYNFGIKHKYLKIEHNPFAGLQVIKDKKKKKTLQDKQLEQMDWLLCSNENIPNILTPNWFFLALVKTLRYTAIRRKQLLKMKISDIDFNKKLLHISAENNKSHKDHTIPLSNKLMPYLERLYLEHQQIKSPPCTQFLT
ncbi:tyrosine-type recombinase/integrase [Haemophilus paracuniculus]|uniref:tyrosine-type recombinase/integrase n=1 Tax=Haemophilus paracuniculus TaxID=734 RepID=UPI00117B2C1A|nr:site-specific integrase [Haemophilus paracuniculus]